jgi:predicted nucleic acid-binding protein
VVSLPALKAFLKKHTRIGLDSNILIYFIEAHPLYHNMTQNIFEAIEAGRNIGICSTLSLLEVLVQPYRLKNKASSSTSNSRFSGTTAGAPC